jgi:hypothetical protein
VSSRNGAPTASAAPRPTMTPESDAGSVAGRTASSQVLTADGRAGEDADGRAGTGARAGAGAGADGPIMAGAGTW